MYGSHGHSCLTFENSPHCFLKQLYHFTLQSALYEASNFSTVVFLCLFNCSCSRLCEAVSHCDVGICFFDANDVHHLFMCSEAICISSQEKDPFKSFAHFLVVFLVFGLSCKISLYIMDTCPLLQICCAKIFSHIIGCLFTLLFFGGVVIYLFKKFF